MVRTTDYRTEYQKKKDAERAEIYERYKQLRQTGLTLTRACTIAATENEWTTNGVFRLVKRIEAQQAG